MHFAGQLAALSKTFTPYSNDPPQGHLVTVATSVKLSILAWQKKQYASLLQEKSKDEESLMNLSNVTLTQVWLELLR